MRDYLDEYIVATKLIFRPQGATISELAETLDKTERAVYNLLSQLDMMEFPIWDEQDPDNPKKKRYHANSTFTKALPCLDFTETDKAVFNYLIDNTNNAPAMEIEARRLFTKLKLMAAERGSLLEKGDRKTSAIISSSAVVKDIDNKQMSKTSAKILDAINRKRWITIEYDNIHIGKSFKSNVYPIVLFVHEGNYYLYVFTNHEVLKILAVERIKNVSKIFEGKIPKTKVDIKNLLSDPFGAFVDTEPFQVRLLIDPWQAYYEKNRKWPESVTFEDTAAGTIMTATTRCNFDCRRWILMRSPYIKVLEPQRLKDEIVQALKDGLDRMQR